MSVAALYDGFPVVVEYRATFVTAAGMTAAVTAITPYATSATRNQFQRLRLVEFDFSRRGKIDDHRPIQQTVTAVVQGSAHGRQIALEVFVVDVPLVEH